MRCKITNPQRFFLCLFSAVILAVGLGSAISIYLTVGNNRDSYLLDDAVGGYIHAMTSKDAKMYGHDLKLYGGKANVPPDEFMPWFAGLWHGESLAFTIAYITVYISFVFFLFAYLCYPTQKTDAPK
jgi:hypothetical protein